MKSNAGSSRVAVSSDGKGLVSQAGAVLLWETMRVTGLARGLSENLARWRAPRAVHDPGKVIADLAAFADHGAAGNGEPLAILLRHGSAGSNTAADHVEVTRLALAQRPRTCAAGSWSALTPPAERTGSSSG